jgi:Zn-dependent protease
MGFLEKYDLGLILVQYVVLLFSLCFHEAAHAWMAYRCGDYTAYMLGRVTLNPKAHIDWIGTVIFPILQFFTAFPLIGWAKPVPVNSHNLRDFRRDHMLISAAGPGSNLLLGGGCLILLFILKSLSPEVEMILYRLATSMHIPKENLLLGPLVGFLFFGMIINLALALFNLIPIPPLDGHWILAGFLYGRALELLESMKPYGFIVLYALMFFGVLQWIFLPINFILQLLF